MKNHKPPTWKFLEGENTIKRDMGTKVKVLFQGLHMTHVIYVLVYNLKFCYFDTNLTLHVRYKYVSIANWFYIIYIVDSCPLSHIYNRPLLKSHFQNQNHVWTKCV